MKFLKFTILSLLVSFAFIACEKDKTIGSVTPAAETPVAETKPVQGTWMGTRIGLNKSIPLYFGFQVKTDGKLEVFDAARQVIGTGSWTFNNEVFAAKYTITSSGLTYSVQSDFYEKPDRIGGTWGNENDYTNGGTWEMTKTN